ncbi:MAG TPA: hypothetical protein VI603_02475 [Saprospiraceae bacterium]|nr:hypothetical protein [Saprospiraceae bacterium]
MKNLFCLTLFIAGTLTVSGQSKAIYVNPDFNKLAKNHKELAILPFDVTMDLRPKEREQITDEQLHAMETSEGKGVQGALHSYFLKKRTQNDFKVDFQDPRKTNAELTKAGIDFTTIRERTPAELAALLGVDGIVWGDFRTSKPMSEEASAALGILFGIWGPTNSGSISIQISDGKSEEILWKYDKTLSRSLGSDINTIIDAMMRKASRKFPYNFL